MRDRFMDGPFIDPFVARRMVARFSINWCKQGLPIVPRRSPAGRQGDFHAVVGDRFQERLKETETP